MVLVYFMIHSKLMHFFCYDRSKAISFPRFFYPVRKFSILQTYILLLNFDLEIFTLHIPKIVYK